MCEGRDCCLQPLWCTLYYLPFLSIQVHLLMTYHKPATTRTGHTQAMSAARILAVQTAAERSSRSGAGQSSSSGNRGGGTSATRKEGKKRATAVARTATATPAANSKKLRRNDQAGSSVSTCFARSRFCVLRCGHPLVSRTVRDR